MRFIVLLCCFISLAALAEDLTLPDGTTYRNCKIKSVKNNRVTLAYILPDGSPDVAVIPLTAFSQEFQARYRTPGQIVGSVNWKAGKNMPEKLTLALTQLQYDLARAGADDTLRRQTADILYRQLLMEIAQTAESTDLQVISVDGNGTLVKVVGTAAGATLRSGEYLYLSKFKAVYPFFKIKIFNSGAFAKTAKYGTVPVWAASESSAGKAAADFLSAGAGDNTLFAANYGVPYVNAAVPAAPAGNAAPVVINNNYYDKDDDDDRPWVIYRYIDRPGRRPHKPGFKPPHGKPHKPVAKPHKPVEKPHKPVEKPHKPVEKPHKPVEKPQKPVEKPQKPVEKPQKPAVKPGPPEKIQYYPLTPIPQRPLKPVVPVKSTGLELMPGKTAIPVKNNRL